MARVIIGMYRYVFVVFFGSIDSFSELLATSTAVISVSFSPPLIVF